MAGDLVAGGFERVAEVFAENVAARGDTGASLCLHVGGELVVDLVGGDHRTDTLQVVRSATKGVVAIVAHLLAQRGELDLDAPVVEHWPEFADGGAAKRSIPVRWLLSHQAGLPCIDRPLTMGDVVAWEPVVDALAAQEPVWEPGARHGYHALTYGWLVGEVLRRASGRTVGQLVAEELAGPLGLDLWVGAPADVLPRLQPLRQAPPPPADAPPDPLAQALADPTSLAVRSFRNPDLFAGESTPEYLGAEVPGANGVADARSLSRLYAACLGEVDGVRILEGPTLAAAAQVQAEGPDAVVGYETRYASGFQLPFPLRPMAGVGTPCVGHYGMGGPLAFADPSSGLAFAYCSSQIQSHGGPDPRSRLLAEAAREAALAATA